MEDGTTMMMENATVYVSKNPMLYTAYNTMVSVTTAFIMLSMGSGVSWQVVKPHMRRPIAPIIGMVCQLIILPAIAYGFAHAFDFADETSIGMIIMASSPGGAVSNIFSFWSRGDLGLSVTMTTFSTTLALGFFPLNMFIYTQSWTDEDTQIPFLSMFITVLYTWAAAFLGAIIGWKFPQIRPYTTRIGSVLGILLILVCGIIQGQLYPEVFDLPPTLWFCAVIMPLIGYGLGNALGAIFCLNIQQMRTIGYETGMQNAGVALTSIALSYSEQEAAKYVQFPLLYATWMIVEGLGLVFAHWLYFGITERKMVCQKKKDKRSKDLEPAPGDDDNFSLASYSTYASSNGLPDFVPKPIHVDMAIGRYVTKQDDGPTIANGVLATTMIGNDANTLEDVKVEMTKADDQTQKTNPNEPDTVYEVIDDKNIKPNTVHVYEVINDKNIEPNTVHAYEVLEDKNIESRAQTQDEGNDVIKDNDVIRDDDVAKKSDSEAGSSRQGEDNEAFSEDM